MSLRSLDALAPLTPSLLAHRRFVCYAAEQAEAAAACVRGAYALGRSLVEATLVACVVVVLFAAAGEGGGRYCVTEAVKSPEAEQRWDRHTDGGCGRG